MGEKVDKFDKTANDDWRSTLLAFLASRREHASKLGGKTWIYGRSQHAVRASVPGRQVETVADLRQPLEPRLLAEKQKQPGRYKHRCVSHSSLITLFGSLWFLLISRNETAFTKALFAGFHWNVWKTAERPTYDSKKSIPVVLPAVSEMLDPFHNLGKRQPQPITKVCIYFVFDSFREIPNRISYTDGILTSQWTSMILSDKQIHQCCRGK